MQYVVNSLAPTNLARDAEAAIDVEGVLLYDVVPVLVHQDQRLDVAGLVDLLQLVQRLEELDVDLLVVGEVLLDENPADLRLVVQHIKLLGRLREQLQVGRVRHVGGVVVDVNDGVRP